MTDARTRLESPRRRNRNTAARAVGVVSMATVASVLAGCGVTDTLDEFTLGYAVDVPVTTYNANTIDGAYSAAPSVFGRVLTGLSYIGPDGSPIMDRDFGTISPVPGEADSYEINLNESAVFSDGNAVTCDDLVFAWAAGSGRFTAPDPDSGEPRQLFDTATDWGYADIDRIDCEPGTKRAQLQFREGRSFTDWESLFSATTVMPSHVAGREANVPDVVAAVNEGDIDALSRLADFWNTGWTLTPGDLDLDLFPSSGPYKIDSFTDEGGLLLVKNDSWWGDPPRTPRIVVWPGMDTRDIVARGEAQVIDVGAGSVAGLDLAGYTEHQVESLNTEQLVFNNTGVFDDVEARRAFTACVPRLRVADDVVSDYFADDSPRRGVASSRTTQPGSSGYSFIAGPAQENYLQPDIEAASRFTESADMRVRIGYLGSDKRREETVSFIARACKDAGIVVQNVSSRDFDPRRALANDDVDIVLGGIGGVQGPGGLASEGTNLVTLHSRNGLNIGAFSNGRIDGLVAELAVISNADARLERFAEAEAILWNEVPTVPLFVQPRLTAHSGAVVGVVPNNSRAGAGWNMDKWVRD
ncbi:peptide-binding protein [Hoyosella rhizosphaerae]|uniref:Solute-binding protein family 5 domain-containing protein n=1 Tax=Hoyosella rhizosphaerae TaxID=1755582 RepID=A0A916XAE4_9ACTN|nr:ABC transporter substrate-binding protein [Hoyosella rhizosphaerae]MBN4926423.1 peptide-binding protein [Hoyosella rhizosphaerae]GGC59464.1 hypothetical protein GCM10011410_09890 [Hoyosella rhizosphaerae]